MVPDHCSLATPIQSARICCEHDPVRNGRDTPQSTRWKRDVKRTIAFQDADRLPCLLFHIIANPLIIVICDNFHNKISLLTLFRNMQ